MKSIFASLIVALLAISATGKDRPCVFRVPTEANRNDTDWRLIGQQKR